MPTTLARKKGTLNYTINILDSIFDNLPVPFVIVDREGKIVFFNDAYCNILNLDHDRDKILGHHIDEFIPNTRIPLVMETGIAEVNSTHTFPDGRTAIGSRVPIVFEGEVIGCIAYISFNTAGDLQKLAQKYARLEQEINTYKTLLDNRSYSKYSFENIIGESVAIKTCKNIAQKLAGIELHTVISGESGVGKELIVHSIHNESRRRYGPLISVNCGAIPKDLFEAEFFGYEKGAFTGDDVRGKKGYFELASRGTLFLDEIAELPFAMQVKLLRVLEEKEFMRVGGSGCQRCDLRVIAATNKNLENLVNAGEFREDLYYRVSALVLEIPPLRKRKEDIPLLIKHFVNKFCTDHNVPGKDLSTEAAKLLLEHRWPGNIRELKHVIERALIFTERKLIDADDIRKLIHIEEKPEAKEHTLKDYLKAKETEYIETVLHEVGQKKSEAAKRLGIHRSILYKKLKY